MLQITSIKNGFMLDHIKAGMGVKIFRYLHLDELGHQVALIINADSKKMGKKDILKVDRIIDINLDAIGYIDPGITVNIIENGKLAKRTHIDPPDEITNVIKCKNPRCITTTEQELPHVFRLTDKENRIYRCIYCESKAK